MYLQGIDVDELLMIRLGFRKFATLGLLRTSST